MIYLECDPDKSLVQTLGLSSKEIKRVYSKGNVCNKSKMLMALEGFIKSKK